MANGKSINTTISEETIVALGNALNYLDDRYLESEDKKDYTVFPEKEANLLHEFYMKCLKNSLTLTDKKGTIS